MDPERDRLELDTGTPAAVPATVQGLAAELVHVYDVLDNALRLALVTLETGGAELGDQCAFWRTLLELDTFLNGHGHCAGLEEWIATRGPRPEYDAPVVRRRRECAALAGMVVVLKAPNGQPDGG